MIYFFIFLLLICVILYWYCKKKLCLVHSWQLKGQLSIMQFDDHKSDICYQFWIFRFSGHKLVHLDLKGAPTKMTFLIQVSYTDWSNFMHLTYKKRNLYVIITDEKFMYYFPVICLKTCLETGLPIMAYSVLSIWYLPLSPCMESGYYTCRM